MVLKLFAELLDDEHHAARITPRDSAARSLRSCFRIRGSPTRARRSAEYERSSRANNGRSATSGERIGAITASFGVARLNAAESAEDLVRRADAKLYEAKSSGRNWVLVDVAGETRRRGRTVKNDFAGSEAMGPRNDSTFSQSLGRGRAFRRFGAAFRAGRRNLGLFVRDLRPADSARREPGNTARPSVGIKRSIGSRSRKRPRARPTWPGRRATTPTSIAAELGLTSALTHDDTQPGAASIHVEQPPGSSSRRAARTRQPTRGDRQYARRPRAKRARARPARAVTSARIGPQGGGDRQGQLPSPKIIRRANGPSASPGLAASGLSLVEQRRAGFGDQRPAPVASHRSSRRARDSARLRRA